MRLAKSSLWRLGSYSCTNIESLLILGENYGRDDDDDDGPENILRLDWVGCVNISFIIGVISSCWSWEFYTKRCVDRGKEGRWKGRYRDGKVGAKTFDFLRFIFICRWV